MTQLLEKAFQIAFQLPQEDQDALAYWILEEIESKLMVQTVGKNRLILLTEPMINEEKF